MTTRTDSANDDRHAKRRLRKVIAASMIGTSIEWYDFLLFGSVSALVFGKIFFPTFEPLAGTLLALSTFGVGFMARPLGGVLFGHLGDRVGRKAVLVTTLLLMGGCTFLVGLLPGYGTIGVAAPLLLVLLRLVQGIGLGGEWGGAVLMVAEHGHQRRRGFHASWLQAASPAGLIGSTIALSVVSSLTTEAQFEAWGWRIPFLFSGVLVVVGLYVRTQVEESPLFENIRHTQQRVKAPILHVLKNAPLMVVLAVCAGLGQQVTYYVANIFSLTYATTQGLERSDVLNIITVGAVVQFVSLLVWGAVSDRIGRRKPLMIGAVAMAAWGFLFFPLFTSGHAGLALLAVGLAMIFQAAMYGPLAAFISELFDTEVRYTGTSLGYQLIAVVGGGLAPIISVALLNGTGGVVAVSIYVAAACAATLIAVALGPETSQREFSAGPTVTRPRTHG